MTDTQTASISLTASAVEEVKRLRTEESIPEDLYLRIGVKGGGCSGLTYILDFDKLQDFDQKYTIDGVEVLVDKRHELYIAGMQVDYEHGLNDRGFIFVNPNASSTCGCGTSFAT